MPLSILLPCLPQSPALCPSQTPPLSQTPDSLPPFRDSGSSRCESCPSADPRTRMSGYMRGQSRPRPTTLIRYPRRRMCSLSPQSKHLGPAHEAPDDVPDLPGYGLSGLRLNLTRLDPLVSFQVFQLA